jgi:hypothetical protein
MISLICFDKDLVIPKEEAIKLNLKYQTDSRIGYHENELKELRAYNYYKEDCIEKDGKYYKDKAAIEKDDPSSDYYLFEKYTGDTKYVTIEQDNHLVDLNLFAPKCKYKFYLKESIISQEPTINNIQAILGTIEEKSTALESLVDKIKDSTFNSKTNVHVGGGLITTYNDLLLKEDTCTDDLQNELNNGWRIIAVCTQADQRRPDYVLGRFNPQLKVAEKPNADR